MPFWQIFFVLLHAHPSSQHIPLWYMPTTQMRSMSWDLSFLLLPTIPFHKRPNRPLTQLLHFHYPLLITPQAQCWYMQQSTFWCCKNQRQRKCIEASMPAPSMIPPSSALEMCKVARVSLITKDKQCSSKDKVNIRQLKRGNKRSF